MPDTFLTPDQVKELVRDGIAEGIKSVNTPTGRPGEDSPATKTTPPMVNFNRPQRPSLGRAIHAGITRGGDWTGAELERDITQATKELFLSGSDGAGPNSIVFPTTAYAYASVLEKAVINTEARKALGEYAMKALAEGVNAVTYANLLGAALVPVQFLQDEFVLALLSAVALRGIPEVRTVPVTSNVIQLPRENTQAVTTNAAEAGVLASADPAFATQHFTIQKQYGYRTFSNELLRDSNPAIDSYIMRTLVRDIALYQDQQFLEGTGVGTQLTGIRNYAGLTTSSFAPTNGAAVSADNLIDMVFDIRRANAEICAWIMHPRTLQGIMKLKDASGRYIFTEMGVWGGPVMNPAPGTGLTYPNTAKGNLLGYPVYLSTQIPLTETQGTSSVASHIIYGDFRFALILERQAVEIAVSEHVAFNTDQTAVRAIARSALALTQPLAFAVATGAL